MFKVTSLTFTNAIYLFYIIMYIQLNNVLILVAQSVHLFVYAVHVVAFGSHLQSNGVILLWL